MIRNKIEILTDIETKKQLKKIKLCKTLEKNNIAMVLIKKVAKERQIKLTTLTSIPGESTKNVS